MSWAVQWRAGGNRLVLPARCWWWSRMRNKRLAGARGQVLLNEGRPDSPGEAFRVWCAAEDESIRTRRNE